MSVNKQSLQLRDILHAWTQSAHHSVESEEAHGMPGGQSIHLQQVLGESLGLELGRVSAARSPQKVQKGVL
jgi:hypothetical protein